MATKKKSKNYIDKHELIEEIKKSQQIQREHPDRQPAECFTRKLTEFIMLLVDRYASKGSWVNYTYNEDMRADALANLCKVALKFDPEKSDNPFAYYTKIIQRCFITFNEKERKQRDIKDDLIEVHTDSELKPSFSRQMEGEFGWTDVETKDKK